MLAAQTKAKMKTDGDLKRKWDGEGGSCGGFGQWTNRPSNYMSSFPNHPDNPKRQNIGCRSLKQKGKEQRRSH